MMESSSEPIVKRLNKLENAISSCGIVSDTNSEISQHLLAKEGLFDALLVLYDECNTDTLRGDPQISTFLKKYCCAVEELRQLRVNINDFEQKKVIGKGHFGIVQVCCEKQTGNVYALKTLRKEDTLAQQHVTFYEEEKNIMAKAVSPWITHLQYAFQDDKNLYLVMDFHPGGDLLCLLDRFNYTIGESMMRFYLSEITIAIHAVHQMGYVHRDVKPENILIDRCGHIRLADFGSAAKLNLQRKVNSQMPVGTPYYVAPEVLTLNERSEEDAFYGVECDFWSLGILAFEMLYGDPPFKEEKVIDTYSSIMNYKNNLKFPVDGELTISNEAKDLIKGLLEEACERFGYTEVVNHPFFLHVDFNNLEDTTPPFIPIVNAADDTSNFEDFEDSPPFLSSGGNLGFLEHSNCVKRFSGKQLPFIGFTYVRPVNDVHSSSNLQCSILNSTIANFEDAMRDPSHVEEELKLKKKELHNAKLELEKLASSGEHVSQMQQMEKRIVQLGTRLKMTEKDREDFENSLKIKDRALQKCKHDLASERAERSKTETKTLQFLQEVKTKWKKDEEAKFASLNDKMEIYRKSAVSLSEDKDEALKKLQELAHELHRTESTGHKYKKLAKEKTEQVEQLKKSVEASESRQCKGNCPIGIETQLRLSQVKVQFEQEQALNETMQSQLNELQALNNDAESALEKKNCETVSRIDDLEEKALKDLKLIEIMKDQLREQTNHHMLLENQKIETIEIALRQEREESSALRRKLEVLTRKLNESEVSIESQNSTFAIRQEEMELKLNETESDLEFAKREHEELKSKLDITVKKDDSYRAKIKELECCLGTLNETLKTVEFRKSDYSVDKQRFEAQVELLQNQLKESQEVQQQSGINLTKAMNDLDKAKRELSNVKLDMRSAERELKSSKETVQFLRERSKDLRGEVKGKEDEMKKFVGKLEDMQKQYNAKEDEFSLMKAKNVGILECRDQCIDELAEELKMIKELNLEIPGLEAKLKVVQENESSLTIEKRNLENEAERLERKIAAMKTKEDELMKMIRQMEEKIDQKELTISQLKEICVEQDDQLAVVDQFEQKSIAYEEQIKNLQVSFENAQADLKTSRASINEEKSLRLYQEKRVKDLEKKIADNENDSETQLLALQEQMDSMSNENLELQGQIAELENELRESDNEKRLVDHEKVDLEGQIELLKEESAGHIRHISAMKDSNFKLSSGIDEAVTKGEYFKNRIIELESELCEKKAEYSAKEHKWKCTNSQQSKLIAFLHAKMENPPKRKKTLSTIFGKENDSNSIRYERQYRDIEGLLEREKALGSQLSQQLLRAQAEVVTLKAQVKYQESENTVSRTPYSVISRSKNALKDLSNSPNMKEPCTPRQRMKHKIPHRWQPHLVMRAGRCVGCLGGIPFSRNALRCQECGVTAHSKCSMGVANTCGLPKAYANHFTQSFKEKMVAKPEGQKITIEGFVKVPKSGKAQWERKYACLVGTNLLLYDQPPVKLLQPLKEIELIRKRSHFSVHSAVPRSELPNTAASEVPYIIKILLRGEDDVSCSHFMMMQSFEQKQIWVNILEEIQSQNFEQDESDDQNKGTVNIDLMVSLQSATPMDVNSITFINQKTVLVGATEGLFSFERDPKTGKMNFRARIEGFTTVHQIIMVRSIGIVVLIAGKENLVFMNDLLALTAGAEASQMARPSLSPVRIDPLINCHLVDASEMTDKKTFMCAAASDGISILVWSPDKESFVVCRQFSTQEPCSCFLFTPSSLIVGAERFYKINLKNFEIDEYLDEKDTSLAYAIYGSAQMSSFPVAVIQVSLPNQPDEYLLAFYEFGIFVDSHGRRSREFDLKFSRLPVGIIFLRPYLFILHQSSIEVIEIRPESFTKIRGMSFDSDTECAPVVRTANKSIVKPRFIGKCLSSSKVFAASNLGESLEIVSISTEFPEDFDSSIGWSSVNGGSSDQKMESEDTETRSDTSTLSTASLRSTVSSDPGDSTLKRTRFPNFMRASKRSKTSSKRDVDK